MTKEALEKKLFPLIAKGVKEVLVVVDTDHVAVNTSNPIKKLKIEARINIEHENNDVDDMTIDCDSDASVIERVLTTEVNDISGLPEFTMEELYKIIGCKFDIKPSNKASKK